MLGALSAALAHTTSATIPPTTAARTGQPPVAAANRALPSPRRAEPRAGRTSCSCSDDLSMNLVPFRPHVPAMERAGLTFGNYFVSDSLCCPSRASIFTGDFPHDTGAPYAGIARA